MNYFDVGDVVRLRLILTDSAGTLVDPTSLTLQYRQWKADPASITTLIYGVNSIVKTATGNYFHDLAVSSSGQFRYRWNATGDNASAQEGIFTVRTRHVG